MPIFPIIARDLPLKKSINIHFCSDCTGRRDNGKKVNLQLQFECIKEEWKHLWLYRIDDKVKAESIADRDFSLLFVERGTVIMATKDFKPLNLREILNLHEVEYFSQSLCPPPSIGGWRNFARRILNKQKRVQKLKSNKLRTRRNNKNSGQKRQGGRGWLHIHMNR